MPNFIRQEIDGVIEILEMALDMRKNMAAVATSKEHIQSTKTIILSKVKQLWELMHTVNNIVPKATELEVIAWLDRIMVIKIDLHSIAEVFYEVKWAAFDEAMTAGYKYLEG